MPWAKLCDTFADHPKVVRAGNEAVGAYARMLSWSARHSTNGRVPDALARTIARPAILKQLAAVELIHREGQEWEIHDFLDFNPSRTDVAEKRAARAEAGRRGGIASGEARRQAVASSKSEATTEARASGSASHPGEPRTRTRSPSPLKSPQGDREWNDFLEHYRQTTGRTNVRGSQPARRAFAARRAEGRTLDDLKFATVGCHSDDWCRSNGYDVPETILRASKVERYLELGKAASKPDRLDRLADEDVDD